MKRLYIWMILFFTAFAAVFPASQRTNTDYLFPGLEAYSRSDWPQAILFFRKAVSQKETANSEAWYWLIMSEMSAGDYSSAEADADIFLSSFLNDPLTPDVSYQRGRALYQNRKYEESIKQLYAFLDANPQHELASSALFWIGESLYDLGSFENALLIYTRLIQEYPDSPRKEAAAYRSALIGQRGREEELLKLLKASHEESLKVIEEYQRRERVYEQAVNAYQKRIADLLKDTRVADLEAELGGERARNAALQERIALLENKVARLESEQNAAPETQNSAELELLRQKAETVQSILDSRTPAGGETK